MQQRLKGTREQRSSSWDLWPPTRSPCLSSLWLDLTGLSTDRPWIPPDGGPHSEVVQPVHCSGTRVPTSPTFLGPTTPGGSALREYTVHIQCFGGQADLDPRRYQPSHLNSQSVGQLLKSGCAMSVLCTGAGLIWTGLWLGRPAGDSDMVSSWRVSEELLGSGSRHLTVMLVTWGLWIQNISLSMIWSSVNPEFVPTSVPFRTQRDWGKFHRVQLLPTLSRIRWNITLGASTTTEMAFVTYCSQSR